MGRMKKSTRKFEKNHLKDTLEHRKDVAKIKQRSQVKEKKKARRAKQGVSEPTKGEKDPSKASKSRTTEDVKAYGDMDVDEFFQGGFDISKDPGTARSSRIESRDKPKGKAKKRKRDDDEDEDDNQGGSSGSSSEELLGSIDPVSDLDTGDDELDVHKRDLDALAEKDPEFYEYLKQNDTELLYLSKRPALIGAGLMSETEDGPSHKAKRKQVGRSAGAESDDEQDQEEDQTVTMATVKKWKTAMSEIYSLRAMRQVALAFRAAVHVNEEDENKYKYTISSPEVYHELLLLALQHIPDLLGHHLPVKESSSGKIHVPTDSKKYRSLTPLLKSYTASVHHLLTTLSDAATLKLTLSSFVPLLPYLLSFKKLLRGLVRSIVATWSDPANTEATRIAAFLVVRRLAVIGDAGLREMVLKSVYQGLVKGSKNTTIHTMPGVNLMKNSAAELWGLDASVGYTTGFAFIRQLAIHLRGSITNTTKDSYRAVYNWQYVHSLDFWSRVLTLHCAALREAEAGKESTLRPLIYPLVQITLGTLRLIPTAQYFPLRFQLIRALLRLSGPTGVYIPLAPALLEVLSSSEMKKPPKPSTLKGLDFATSIRAPKAYLRTRVYQDGVGEQINELLVEFFVQWTKSIAFPELALPVIVMLKRWLKEASNRNTGNKNAKVNSAIVLLVQKLEANSKWVEEYRAKVDFAPNDRAGVEAFLRDVDWSKSPLGAFVVGQRKQKGEREKLLEESRRGEEKRKGQDRDEDDEDMMNSEMSDDDDDEEEED